MALAIQHRVLHGRRGVVARQQHRGAEIDRPAPELREQRTLDLEALDPRGVGRHLHCRDLVRRRQLDRLGRCVDAHALHFAIEVAGRDVPVLPFPLVVVHPHHVTVGALELGVDVDEPLHEVVARRQVAQARHRRAEIGHVDDGALARRQLLDVTAEERRAGASDLQPRLAVVGAGHHHVDAAGDRARVDAGGERDLDAHAAAGRRRLRGHAGYGGHYRHDHCANPSPHHDLR